MTYYNPSSKPQTIQVEAVMDENMELLDAYEGKYQGDSEEKTICWTIPDVKPYAMGSVSFAASLAKD